MTRRQLAACGAAALALACIAVLRWAVPARDVAPLGFAPISAQVRPPQTLFVGQIDPTNPVWAGGVHACTSSCTAVAPLNTVAFKTAIDYAAAHTLNVYMPPGQFPFACGGAGRGVDFSGDSNITITAYGSVFRFTGDQASADCDMFAIRNDTHVRIIGATFSGRDVTNTTTSTNLVKIGDGGSTTVDDVHLTDCAFVAGLGGDYVRMDGGAAATTVTRVTIDRGSRFEGSARAGIDIRPGVQDVAITYDWFKGNASRDIYFEAAVDNVIGRTRIVGNFLDRTGSTSAQSITLSGYGGTNSSEQTIVEFNHVLGGVIDGVNVGRTRIEDNDVRYNVAGSSTALIDLSGKVYDVWVVDNYGNRGVTAANGSVIRVAADGTNAPHDVQVIGNRVLQYSGIAPGIDLTGTARVWAAENDITYNTATADSGSAGFVGIYCAGNTSGVCSGVYAMNRVKKDVLSDGTTPAGRMLAGVELLKGTGTTVGRLVVRDNVIDGAASTYYIDADGAAQWPEGYPVLSGQFGLNVAAEIAGGITTYRTETTSDAETITTGALAIAKHVAFISTAGTVAYTLADGASDGFEKTIKIKAATSTPAGTLTPTHFADGSTHTLTWSAAGGFARLRWDATSTTWRLVGISATGMTLN